MYADRGRESFAQREFSYLINGEGEFFTLDSSYHINELHFHTGTRSDSYEWAWPLHSLLWCLLIWCCNLWTRIRPAPLFQHARKGPSKSLAILYAQIVVVMNYVSLSLSLSRSYSWLGVVFFALSPLMQGRILPKPLSNCSSSVVVSIRMNGLYFLRWGTNEPIWSFQKPSSYCTIVNKICAMTNGTLVIV